MRLTRRSMLAAAAAAVHRNLHPTRAQARPVIRLGVMNDQSGPYRDVNGPTSVLCAKQAVQEFAGGGFDVEVLTADHQNKPDVAVSLAREWFDQRGVDIVMDIAATSCALALASIVKEKNKIMIATSTASSRRDREGVHARFDPLGVRHVHGGALDRRRHGEGRWRQLVFHHAELRVR